MEENVSSQIFSSIEINNKSTSQYNFFQTNILFLACENSSMCYKQICLSLSILTPGVVLSVIRVSVVVNGSPRLWSRAVR